MVQWLPEDFHTERMFKKEHLDALFDELHGQWHHVLDFESLARDAHLGIALSDAGRPLDEIDPRVAALIDKHRPPHSSRP